MTFTRKILASLRRRWSNTTSGLWFYVTRLPNHSPLLRFLGRRYRNNTSAIRYHWATFHFRCRHSHYMQNRMAGTPFYLVLELVFRRDWNQFIRFDQYAPRPLVFKKLPVRRKPAGFPLSVGLVTPSFNQGHFLEQTMRSVLTQEFPRLQYAVVDGGSNDGSPQLIEKYRNCLIYGVSEPDQGQSDALVKGFAKIDADILGYLNADDLLAPGSLAFVADYFSRNPEVDVIYSHRIIIDENGREVGRWILPPHDEHSLRRVDYIPQETLFWRRRLYEKVGGIDSSFHYAMDWDIILKFMDAGAEFRRVQGFLGCFRSHPAQKTAALSKTVGEREVQALRRRQGICESEIDLASFRYRRAAAFYSIAHRLGLPAR